MSVPAYIINLEGDTERRAHMQSQLQAAGMQAEFVPAIYGKNISDAERALVDRSKTLRVYGVDMLDNEIGCYLSHYRLWEKMLRENIPVALIMEDDITISPALPRIVQELAEDKNPEWLVVRLESLRPRVREPKKPAFLGRIVKQLSDGALHRLDTHVLGFGAYLIRKEGAQRMLEYGKRIFMPVDQTMDRFYENGIIPYIVRPLPTAQRQDFTSRIGARPANRHVGYPLSVQIARRWQRMMDGIRKRLFLLTHR